MAGYPRIEWNDSHLAKIRELAAEGHSRPAIARIMGLGLPWLTWKITQDEPTRRAWREGYDLWHHGGPISPELKALADRAAAARRERMERNESIRKGA